MVRVFSSHRTARKYQPLLLNVFVRYSCNCFACMFSHTPLLFTAYSEVIINKSFGSMNETRFRGQNNKQCICGLEVAVDKFLERCTVHRVHRDRAQAQAQAKMKKSAQFENFSSQIFSVVRSIDHVKAMLFQKSMNNLPPLCFPCFLFTRYLSQPTPSSSSKHLCIR